MVSAAKTIVDHRGVEQQSRQAMEEMAELTVALSHFLRGRTHHTGEILEEVADVEIMLEQLKYAFNLSQDDIDYIKKMKVQRELGRIRTESEQT